MKTRKLDETAFKATMTPKMRNVTATASGPDIFPYVEAIPVDDLRGYELNERIVEYVYRSDDDRFDHVLVMTRTKNVYLAIVFDLGAEEIYGHHLLDLNELYGLKTKN